MEQIKVAVFGTGFMGRVHVEALRRLGNVEVVAVAGRTVESAREFAAAHSIERSTGDYRELLSGPELNAVHICSPNSLHFPMAKAALEAEKHVLCEKPLASSVAEALAMAALTSLCADTGAAKAGSRFSALSGLPGTSSLVFLRMCVPAPAKPSM